MWEHCLTAATDRRLVRGCWAFRLLLPEYVGPYQMVEVAVGAGVRAFGGTDVCAGGAAIMEIGIVPAQISSETE